MARSRQRWFVPLAVLSSASIIVFAAAATQAQTLTDDGSSMPASSASASAAPVSSAPASPWPCRLTVIGELRAVAELAWKHSSTFRDQCRKLAAAGATMIVRPASSRETLRAQTRIGTTHDGVTIAFARVRPSQHAVELIAHELEHVVEYLEGVKFLLEAHRDGSRVRLSGGAYETQRAIDAGRRVAREVPPQSEPH